MEMKKNHLTMRMVKRVKVGVLMAPKVNRHQLQFKVIPLNHQLHSRASHLKGELSDHVGIPAKRYKAGDDLMLVITS